MADKTLNGKVALVTGASSGVGRGIALGLADRGVSVICYDLKPEANPTGFEKDLEITTSDMINNQGGQAVFFEVDISQPSQIEHAFNEAIVAPFRKFAVEDDELWQKLANTNLLGTAKCNRLAIKQFLKQEVDDSWGSRGRIINVSSCAANIAFPYSATKAAINHMTRAGALDHAEDWININCIAPGVVATGMSRQNFEDPDMIKHMKKATPWPRLGTVEDITAIAMFLCSKQSSWLTGQIYAVDGGMTLGVPP